MDFSFSEDQQDLAALAKRILEDKVTEELLREIDAGISGGAPRFDRGLWDALGVAGLLGIALPDDVGGGGLGIIELCLVLEQVGRAVAPVPVVASSVLGADPIAAFGSDALRQRWVAGAADGSLILTAALVEPNNRAATRPATIATPSGDGWRIDGVKTCVPAGTIADAFVVPATTRRDRDAGAEGEDDEVVVVIVEAGAAGLSIEPQRVTNGDAEAQLTLAGVEVGADAVVGSPAQGREIVQRTAERATLALCAQQLGVVSRALEMTAAYSKERVQFDRPIATFQAVGQRLADAYIDVEAVRLTMWQAAWRLAAGVPATTEVEVAKFWAAEAAHRVGHAAVHVHGGIGIDLDYPLHRYFVAAKEIEFTLGGSTDQLLRIGASFAATRE
jgi:acyl-CoA dehydrogenase